MIIWKYPFIHQYSGTGACQNFVETDKEEVNFVVKWNLLDREMKNWLILRGKHLSLDCVCVNKELDIFN